MASNHQKRPRGLIQRSGQNGTVRLYWTCSKLAKNLGYKPTLVPVHLTDDDAIAETCRRLEDQMLAFIARREGAAVPQPSRITLSYVFRQYRERESSGFSRIKWNTRKQYSQVLDQLEDAIGSICVNDINIDFLWRIYNDARWPAGQGNQPDHITKAHNFIKLLRRALSFGVKAELPGCGRVKAILDEERFPAPPPRLVRPEYGHVSAFIEAAKAHGRLSLALGTAIQFECGLRQRDVIGEWEVFCGAPRSDYVINRRQWVNGLVWGDIGADGVMTKVTTKTGAVVRHDLTLCPLTWGLITEIRRASFKAGDMPLIVDEATGRPYAEMAYGREWRIVARAAGIPDTIRNMDLRAGGATEADEAGAAPTDIQRALGHSDVKTTMRYIRSDALGRTRRVAEARASIRGKGERDGNKLE